MCFIPCIYLYVPHVFYFYGSGSSVLSFFHLFIQIEMFIMQQLCV